MIGGFEQAVELGASEVNLDVFTFNDTARDFYEKLGFRAVSSLMSKQIT